jgi:hypothetical protein
MKNFGVSMDVQYTSHSAFGLQERPEQFRLDRAQKKWKLHLSLVSSITACGLLLSRILTVCRLTCPDN